MKRPLILAAIVALAIGLLTLGGVATRDAAHAHTTTTPATTCTDTTLGGTGARAANAGLAADCDRLYTLRYALTTPEALNWNLNLPITSWTGVTLSGSPLRVTGLRLTPYTFTAALPELTHLPKLVDLDLVTYTTPVTLPTPATPGTPPTAATTATTLPANPPTCTSTTLGGTRAANAALAGDCDTLLSIKSTLEGSNLATEKRLNWSAATALTSWKGVTVSTGTPKRIIELALENQSLAGIIPTQLGNLAELTRLDLSGNELGSGPPAAGETRGVFTDIPTQIGKLTKLTTLDLSHNKLWGHIPTQLGDLTELTELNLRGWLEQENVLTGKIPTQLGKLTKLTVLNLRHNRLGGDFTADAGYGIPTQLGGLLELTELRLNNNFHLGGPIPTQLGKLTKLTNLNLNVNQLSGPLPTQLGNLVNLRGLQLSRNQLSGSVPTQLGKLPALRNILLRYNRFSGGIPPFDAPLEGVHFRDNSFTGCVPKSLPAVASNDIAELNLPATCVVATTPEKTD